MNSSLSPSDQAKAVSRSLVIDPYCAVEIAPRFFAEHETKVSEDAWIEANRKLLAKLGDEAYLRLLLDVLKGVDIVSQNRAELADMIEMHFGSSSN